jgi:hypothetical protein
MNSSRLTIVAVAACLASSIPGQAFAWGPDGHRIVCRIAYQLLDSASRNEIQRLTSLYGTPDGGRFTFFTDGCLFPDEARSKARDNVPGWDKYDAFEIWHFLNVPRTTHGIEDDHCDGNCVLTGIAHHAERLRTASTDEARAEALFFLGHWVGDIHQPLHISYTDDRGGNQIQPIHGGFYLSGHLHGVWDSGIIGKAVGTVGWRIYADRLAREITPAESATWVGGPPISWAQESYNLTTRPKTQYCAWRAVTNTLTCGGLSGVRTLKQPYQDEFQDDVEMRLQQAGTRLADLLRRNLVVP